jgi:hypothetical protein
MFVLLHVVIALASVCYTTYLFFRPTKKNFRTSYALIGLTFATGTYLVWRTHAPLLQSCLAGLTYLTVVSVGVAAAQYRISDHTKTD